jgi:hypothetical protein
MEMRSQQSWNQCGVVSLLSKDVQASESQILFLLMTRFDNDSFSSVQSGTFLHAAWNYRVATRLCDVERICRVVAKTTQWLFSCAPVNIQSTLDILWKRLLAIYPITI